MEGMEMGGMMMQMYFYVSAKATILFKSWETSSWEAMFGSFIAVFLMGVVFEGIKALRAHLMQKGPGTVRPEEPAPPNEYTPVAHPEMTSTKPRSFSGRERARRHVIQTALHFLQTALGYSLMLVAMTFNLWLFLAVVLGITCGYLCFGWMQTTRDFSDDCCA